jgi:hypothetical protein
MVRRTLLRRTSRDRLDQRRAGARFATAERKCSVTLPLPWFVPSRSPALADIIGARRARTAVMISSGSMPGREIDVVPRLACPSWRWMMFSGTPSRASSSACA